jgi:DNA transposition AAA+ family ATPase
MKLSIAEATRRRGQDEDADQERAILWDETTHLSPQTLAGLRANLAKNGLL